MFTYTFTYTHVRLIYAQHEKTVNRNTINQPDTSPATGSSGRGFKMKALNGDFDDIGDDDDGGGNEDKNNTTRVCFYFPILMHTPITR